MDDASGFVFCLGRASEMFAYNDGKIHKDFGVTRGDVSFFCGMVQLPAPELWRCADRVELLFRGSKGDQKRYGEVVSRKKTVVGASDSRGIVCHRLFHI